MVVSNLVGTTAASRLLFGMGRDKVISENVFSSVSSRWKTPYKNLIVIILLELALGSCVNLDNLAELINFGAISGFVILNMSVCLLGFKCFQKNIKIKFILRYFICPILALSVMISLFIGMKKMTIIFGIGWALFGILYYLQEFLIKKLRLKKWTNLRN